MPPRPSRFSQAQQEEEQRRIVRERLEAQIRARQEQRQQQQQQYQSRIDGSSNHGSIPRSSAHRGSSHLPLVALEASRHARSSASSSSNQERYSARLATATTARVHHHDPSTVGGTRDDFQKQAVSAKDRLEAYKSTKGKSTARVSSQLVDSEDATIVQYLAVQSMHLPGYTWMQDWQQFILNNHPIFGIFCHHRLHPIKSCTRVVALIGTIVVGLALTNLFYLFYVWNPQFDQPVVQVVPPSGQTTQAVVPNTTATLTTGMLLLWTVGSGIHTAYNLLQWRIAACACCRVGGMCETKACCPSLGKHLLRVLVVIIIAVAILIVLLRVAITNSKRNLQHHQVRLGGNHTNGTATGGGSSGIHFLDDDAIQLQVHKASEFEFLVGYLVEMALALFVYYPIGATIVFSGILGCGRLPFLGGRPFQMRLQERQQQHRQVTVENVDGWSGEDDNYDTGVEVVEEGGVTGGAIPVRHYRTHIY